MLITRITLRVITGYITLDYIIIIRKLIFVNQWSERREYFNLMIKKWAFDTSLIMIINSNIKPRTANRSVYVIGAPHRENFLAKEDR